MIGDPAARWTEVSERAGDAARRSGRRPEDVTLVLATKTVSAERIRAVVAAGARDLGENYVQEARRKQGELAGEPIAWHLIGRLQRNKARAAAGLFEVVHSLDDLGVAMALDRAAAEAGKVLRCLVEVAVAGEATKGGVAPADVARFLEALESLPSLSVDGLMAIPPAMATLEGTRLRFAEVRELRDRLRGLRPSGSRLKELSMGMSADFEAAIEEGATMVRVGTAVFGPRPAR